MGIINPLLHPKSVSLNLRHKNSVDAVCRASAAVGARVQRDQPRVSGQLQGLGASVWGFRVPRFGVGSFRKLL